LFTPNIKCNARDIEGGGPDIDGGNLEPSGACCNIARTRCLYCAAARAIECEFRPLLP
jgi:hypothetical protein